MTMRYLLDSDTVSYLVRKVPAVVESAVSVGLANLCLSTITELEIRNGLAIKNDPKLFASVSEVLEHLEIIPFDSAAAKEAAKVRAFLRALGKPSGTLDPLLAGHAIALGAVLVTNNTKHFENVPGLALDNWLAARD
jgi:tRNA(fMet)-specific endonuclease VapC